MASIVPVFEEPQATVLVIFTFKRLLVAVITTAFVVIHHLASVTMTLYVPAERPEAVWVGDPLLHK